MRERVCVHSCKCVPSWCVNVPAAIAAGLHWFYYDVRSKCLWGWAPKPRWRGICFLCVCCGTRLCVCLLKHKEPYSSMCIR